MTASRRNRFASPHRPSLWGIAVAGLLLMSLGLGTFAWLRTKGDVRLVPAPPASRPSQESGSVNLRVTVFPRTAEVRLDGRRLAENPYDARQPRDTNQEHELSATAPGHLATTRKLRLDRDQEVVLLLENEPPLPAAPTAPRPKPPAVPSSRPATPADAHALPPTSCDPPFFIDERGIKKFKPSCVQ